MKKGDATLIKRDEKNRALWKIGILEHIVPGRSGSSSQTALGKIIY